MCACDVPSEQVVASSLESAVCVLLVVAFLAFLLVGPKLLRRRHPILSDSVPTSNQGPENGLNASHSGALRAVGPYLRMSNQDPEN